jgi:hypothetical protein
MMPHLIGQPPPQMGLPVGLAINALPNGQIGIQTIVANTIIIPVVMSPDQADELAENIKRAVREVRLAGGDLPINLKMNGET